VPCRRAHDPVRLFTAADVPIWYQSVGRAIFLGDVVDPSNRDTMSVGFARYARRAWVVHLRRDGLISRILHVQDLSGVTDLVREAVSKTQPAAT
jgi:hypothetical protein